MCTKRLFFIIIFILFILFMSKLSQGLGPAQFSMNGGKASRSETPGLKPHPGSVSSHEAKISSLPLAQNCTI